MEEEPVLVGEHGGVRIMTLNRSRVLNSLNLDMVARIAELYESWEKEANVSVLLVKATGRVFCAGGDLRMFYDAGKNGESWREVVYKKYWLDYHLYSYQKPVIVFWHGLVMGGGAGFTLPSLFRIVTEKSGFSMPEAAVGFHTDCGASFFLPRLPGYLGEYLALTGARLDAAEMLACGLATHFVFSDDLAELEKRLLSAEVLEPDALRSVINEFAKNIDIKDDSILNRMEIVNKCFSLEKMEDIVESLVDELNKNESNKWLKDTVTTLKRHSPTGLKQTLRSIRCGRKQSLYECLRQEYRLTLNCLRGTISDDLYEGIRAIVVDKDNAPKWKPETFDGVTDDKLELIFKPFKPHEELQLPPDDKITAAAERWTGKYESTVRH